MKSTNIHQFTDQQGTTRFAVCHWVENAAQWQAPLDRYSRRITGCHTEFARTLAGIGGYRNLAKARRRARCLYGYSKLAR